MKMTTEQKKTLIKWALGVVTSLCAALAVVFGLNSCNVTRVITNEAKSVQKGDTTIIIQTKTTESYNASKNN